MSKFLIYGLLLSTLMVIAPHAAHVPLWVSTMCGALLLWRGYLAFSGNPLPKGWLLLLLTLISIGMLVLSFRSFFGREVGVTLLMLLATLKLMEGRTERDAMVSLYLACFIIITNFLYSQSISTALYLILTLVVIVTTWVHLQAQNIALKPRLRIAIVLLLQALPLMLILFVLFPRVQGPLWGLPQDAYASSGLDDQMSPGSISRLSLSEAVAFRVVFNGNAPLRQQMYWRGPVLGNFDGRTWTIAQSLARKGPRIEYTAMPMEYTVTLEPHNKNWLFALEMPTQLSIPAGLTHDFRLLQATPVTSRLRYTAQSQLNYRANVEEDPQQLQRSLRLPANFNPRAQQLASGWRASLPDNDAVIRAALNYYTLEKFTYTLEPPPLGNNSVDDFLFETRQGFCEHYASSFVFLMRAAGIPARVVTGYQGAEYNDLGGYYIVRQSDAHAWAEVWLSGRGWVRIDPTAAISPARVQSGLAAALPDNTTLPFMARNPPQWLRDLRLNWDAFSNQWNQWVLGYDTERQFAFLTRMGMESLTWQKMALGMATGVGILIGLFALFMLRHLFARQPDKVQAAWHKLCRKLAKAGLPRADHEGARDYATRIAAARPDLATAIHALATGYTTLRYEDIQDKSTQNAFLQLAASFKP